MLREQVKISVLQFSDLRSLMSLLFVCQMALIGCQGGASSPASKIVPDEDSSASGTVLSAVGGALAASDSSSVVYSGGTCPTLLTATSPCVANGNAVDLVFSECALSTNLGRWSSGHLETSLAGGGALACGSFPDSVAAPLPNNEGLQRQFKTVGNPGSGSYVNSKGTVITVDHASANLGNFDSITLPALIGTGYGNVVSFDGANGRKSVQLRERLYTTNFDNSLDGTVTVEESSGQRKIGGGTVTVYVNKMNVIGTTSFTNVIYNNQCCWPVSGVVTTVFSAGVNVSPTNLGSAMVGKAETLTITGCGTGTFKDFSGTTRLVTLNNCF